MFGKKGRRSCPAEEEYKQRIFPLLTFHRAREDSLEGIVIFIEECEETVDHMLRKETLLLDYNAAKRKKSRLSLVVNLGKERRPDP